MQELFRNGTLDMSAVPWGTLPDAPAWSDLLTNRILATVAVILLIINAILLIVGTFMDMAPALLIFTPIFLPVAKSVGVNAIQFGVMMIMNLAIGTITPPVGSVLFVGSSVAGLKVEEVVRHLVPYFIVILIGLLMVTFIPELSLWLPSAFGLM